MSVAAEGATVYVHIMAEVCFACAVWVIVLGTTRKMKLPKMNALGYATVVLCRKLFDTHSKKIPPFACLVTSIVLLLGCIFLDKTVEY